MLGVAAFVTVLATQSHYIPIWDSWVYATCVVDASAHPWEFARLGCAGHFSHAYVFLLEVPALLGIDAMCGMLFINAVLGALAILSVHSIARCLLPGCQHRVDCSTIALAFAMHPVFIASAVFINVDYGVLTFGLLTFACLLREKRLCAALVGCFLVFSKEVGAVVYLAMVGSFGLFVVVAGSGSKNVKIRQLVRAAPLVTPLAAVLAYVMWGRPHAQPLWGHMTAETIVRQLLTFAPFSNRTHAQFVGILVLDFMWIPSAALGAWVVWRLISRRLGYRTPAPGSGARDQRCLLGALVVISFFLTGIQTSVSVRYYAIIYPLLLLASLVAATALPIRVAIRRALLGCLIVAFGISNFRTLDPMSRYAYGTFRFGSHPLLAMNSINAECCGFGLDQLVYNLEFVRFHEVIEAALVELRPSGTIPIVVADEMDWFLMARMDAKTYRRTLTGSDGRRVPHLDVTDLNRRKYPPTEFQFVALPNVDNRPTLRELSSRFAITETATHGREGYLLTSYRMRRR